MPVISIDGPKITREQKDKLVKELVAKASEMFNIPEQHFVTTIKENDFDNIGN